MATPSTRYAIASSARPSGVQRTEAHPSEWAAPRATVVRCVVADVDDGQRRPGHHRAWRMDDRQKQGGHEEGRPTRTASHEPSLGEGCARPRRYAGATARRGTGEDCMIDVVVCP